jgi:hypothetical protein
VPASEEAAVPAKDGVGADQQPQLAKHGPGEPVQERCQQRPVGRLEPGLVGCQLALQHRDLVAQGEDLHILVVVADR